MDPTSSPETQLFTYISSNLCDVTDNLEATFLTLNLLFHACTKYVKIDYDFIRKKVASKELNVHFLYSKDQLADIMTKPLPTSRFHYLLSKLTVTDVTCLKGRNKQLTGQLQFCNYLCLLLTQHNTFFLSLLSLLTAKQ
jgi:hypothetical protein